VAVLDHLIYAVPDLDAAVEEVFRSLGVRPAGGGRHEGWGTHNAVLGLGDGAYVELLAPDPSQPTPPRPRLAGLDDLAEPRLVAWAARSDDIEASLERARAAGFDPGPAMAMSRTRPDGVVLTWRVTPPPSEVPAAVPFLIDWGDSPHPSIDAPAGAQLDRFEIEHPDPERTRASLAALGLDLPVTAGPQAILLATLRSDSGVVELS
jgi:hypothetical protein